jgi:menaquinone-specific isochorismate synthase
VPDEFWICDFVHRRKMKKQAGSLYWSSKEGKPAPFGARFSLFPFASLRQGLSPTSIRSTLPPAANPIPVLQRTDTPHRKEWDPLVLSALQSIRSGPLQKVVLARKTTLTLSVAPDPFSIAAAIASKRSGSALFCFALPDGSSFLGATPERLFSREGSLLQTEALAGTEKKRPGGEARLFTSLKSQREFLFVQDYLKEALKECSPTFTPTTVYPTHSLLHLYSQGTALVPPHFSDTTLLQKLHPTPALCGAPKENAARWLHLHEPFDRLYYGGVIGWSHENTSDWMVAIRSIHIQENQVHLYAGVGIVEGSDPDQEWEELEAKIQLYQEIFPWTC